MPDGSLDSTTALELDLRSERMRLAMGFFGIGLWQSDLIADTTVATANCFAMFGMPIPDRMPFPRGLLWDAYHPEDRERAEATFQADLAGLRGADSYCETVRIIRPLDGAIRCMEFTARMFGAPGARTHIVGMMRDVTERLAAEEAQRLLMREVHHRAGNLLAVVQSIIRLTSGDEIAAYRRDLETRILALARSHRLLAETKGGDASLTTILEGELASHRGRIWLRCPPVAIPPRAVQPLGMVLHELATNAAKYGALSTDTGEIRLEAAERQGRLRLIWAEQGGPRLDGPPQRRGTGHAVLRGSARQLGGGLELDWRPHGLVATLTMPLEGRGAGL